MTTTPFRQAGFSLIEALTALLVTAFGMLAIAGFQASLSQSSDIAKQRSEAVRLAQLKIEELRAFQQVGTHSGTPHIFNYTDDVVTGSDTVGPNTGSPTPTIVYPTNTLYARAWNVTGSATDPQKWVRVAVSWTDRTNTTQTVSLQTVISRSDPISIGTLAVGPGGINARTPKNRNVDIPYPAVSLADGKSGFQPGSDIDPNPNPFFIFDNVTGEVLGYCTSPLAAAATVTFGDGVCFEQRALLLSGYIRFVSGGYNQNQVDTVFGNPTGATRALQANIIFINPTTAATEQCFAQRQKVVSVGNITTRNIGSAVRSGGEVTITTTSNHGFAVGQIVSINDVADATFNGVFTITAETNTTFTYAQTGPSTTAPTGTLTPTATLVQQIAIPEDATAPTGYNSVESRYVAYTCIVVPVDHDGNTSTPRRWSGQFVITPLTTNSTDWFLGTGAGQYKLCRYTGDYYLDGVLSNSEHPLYYRGVTGALDNQNYVVVDGDVACPYDAAADTVAKNYINSNTTVHQTQSIATGSMPFGGQLSGSNSGGAAQNGGISTVEPSSTDVELPMFRTGD